VVSTPIKLMDPKRAREVLEESLKSKAASDGRIDLTIADAAARSGLPLRDAERGLHALLSEYRGHLRVTSEGELLFRFPHGFTKPWLVRSALSSFFERAGRGLLGIGRFVVRAWISIVLIGYVLLFVGLVIGLTLARSSGSSRDDRSEFGFGFVYVLFRIVFDALFWTFHPFSPFAIGYHDPTSAWGTQRGYGRLATPPEKKEPFYEKVNRFFFGPDEPPVDPRKQEQAILAEIRAQKGRIGLADVMRVTGLPRDEADPLMARLMLDYEGNVEVSEEGGIVYRFEELRKTVEQTVPSARPAPVWAKLKQISPLTGNSAGTNLLILLLNGFNLGMSWYALNAGLTIENIKFLLSRHRPGALLPDTSTPIALGIVPLVFSIALFALPLARALFRPLKEKKIARENGRRGVLREILTRVETGEGEISDTSLEEAWRAASGRDPNPKELTREVVALGGDVEIKDDGKVRYRFPDLEAEALALKAEREAASEEEARVGKVIFSSEN
jgi:hypothetical protein